MAYAVIPEHAVAALPRLSGSAAKVAVALASFMPGRGTEGCFPSLAALGKRAGIRREKTLTDGIKELVAAGVLICERRRRKTNLYRWNQDPAESAGSNNVYPAVFASSKILDPAVSTPVYPAVSAPLKDTKEGYQTTSYAVKDEKAEPTAPVSQKQGLLLQGPEPSPALMAKPTTLPAAGGEAGPKAARKSHDAPKPRITEGPDGFVVPEAILGVWRESFPGIPIEAETKKAFGWMKSDPSRQTRNLGRFLYGWLARARPAAPEPGPNDDYVVGPETYASMERGALACEDEHKRRKEAGHAAGA